ncbi:MAG: metallophosphoesterase family protein [Planctomycetes bacterium]|nr:metallophosphoesterase family protein [Planctomycetota bacterium]
MSKRTGAVLGFLAVALLGVQSVELAYLIRVDHAARRHEQQSELRHQGLAQYLEKHRFFQDRELFYEELTMGRAQALASESGKALRTPILQRLSQNRVTIVWETGTPQESRLLYRTQGSEGQPVVVPGARYVHEVELAGLSAGTRYEVLVEGSSPLTFQTYPDPMPGLSLAVLGDTQGGPCIETHAVHIAARSPDAILLCGDLVSNGMQYSHWRDQFFKPNWLDLLGRVPLYPVLGNHEFDSPLYYKFFSLPGNERWYSFDLGPARFVALDSNADCSPGGVQYRWAEKELSGPRTKPWLVVFFHHPPYPAKLDPEHGRMGAEVRRHLSPLFERCQVDLVLTGHEHNYYRSVPIGGVTYVITAGGGGGLREHAPEEDLVAAFKHTFHYTMLEFGPAKVEGKAYDLSDEEIDSFVLEKGTE